MARERATLLLIDEDETSAAGLIVKLNEQGYEVVRVLNAEMAMAVLKISPIDIAMATISDELTGFGLLNYLYPVLNRARTPIILLSDAPSWQGYTEAINRGAFDYLGMPLNFTELTRSLQRAFKRRTGQYPSQTRSSVAPSLNAH